jgi:hypothetical protein
MTSSVSEFTELVSRLKISILNGSWLLFPGDDTSERRLQLVPAAGSAAPLSR